MKVLWVATIFNPIFAITDFYNIPKDWQTVLGIRLTVSVITLIMFAVRKKYGFPSRVNIAITFMMISLQNAFIFRLIGNDDLLGQNLNYMALFIGAAMFILWEWWYSVVIVIVSSFVTAFFVLNNPNLDASQFFVKGGLLLGAVAVFMIVLIRTRYDLFIKEIKSRLALNASNEEIKTQAEEIRSINENLEHLVRQRTQELEKKNLALEEYAFINAHKLRAPVASILGLIPIFNSYKLEPEVKEVLHHLKDSTLKLDSIVHSITQAIERGDSAETSVQDHEKTTSKKLNLHH
jgi:Bacteriophytochrome (light-regulated signal transduction histidine kinase)